MRRLVRSIYAPLVLITLFACSNANDKAPNIDPRTGKHPAGWIAADTGGNHLLAYTAGPSACFECHGKNMDGGISSVSCFTAARSGINCHPDGPSGHPVGFLAPSAHGAAAKAMLAGRDGIAHCQVCHGLDYAGGKVNISCLNSAGCHGANVTAPHSPKPWRSSIGGRTHTTTDASNAAGCASCHSGGANSSRKPSSTPPAGTAPGCFNNTLCHGVIGHETGWKAASKHGVAAKAVASGDEGLNACSYCHGAQYDGGTAEQSCLTTNGCHGVKAPHPAKPWRSAAGLTHVSTDTSNAAQCATCHTGGANSDRKPRASDPKGLTGCFDNTLCHGTSGHEAGWNAPAQHGAVAKAAPSTTTGFSSCQPCHGAPFINGAAPTCFNSAVCHGSGVNAPHPKKPWFSASGGLTHTTTNPANAGTCAICHTAGANSTIKPPAPATLTLAGCFNNTLCHFHQIPYAPSASIPASLHGNEAKKDLTVCQTCHGNRGTTAFDGITLADGSKTTACSSCHTFAKAHATDWQGSGSYSHRTAGNRADACSLCHDVTQGRTAPLATAPSCFSVAFTNGLGQARACHPAGPGVTPHGVPYNNHNATARSNFSYCLTCHQNAVITSKPPGCRNCHLLDPVVNANNCISCHANPPAGSGYPNVAGSHASHAVMNVANICEACHSGLGLGTVDHLNRARARSSAVQANPVSFGTLARTGGLNPSYSASTRACTNTYCHGASLAGGSNKAPQWGQAGYNQGCGTCHGFPPNNTAHSGFTNTTPCAGCHTHVNSSNSGFTVPSKHINGSIDATIGAAPHAVPYPGHTNAATCLACHQVAATAANVIPPGCQNCHLTSPLTTPSGCTSCHASPPNGTGYPNVARAHAAHGSASKVAVTSLSCADCHTALGAGTVDHQLRAKARTATGRNNPVVFSSGPLLVLGGGTPPAYIDSNGQCTNVYCHGAKMAGGDTTGSNRTPAWDASLLPATISAAACGACHGFPPSTASGHPGGINIPAGFPAASIGSTCSCHANINTGGNSYANIFVNKALHINGIFEPVVAGGAPHPTPYPGSQHLGVGNGYVAPCGGCHDYTNSGNYPAAAGAPPNCRSCHTASLAAGCADCHGDAATGRPSVNSTQQSAFPTRMGKHLISSHSSRACTVCHPFTTGDARHGWSNNQTSTVAQVGGSGTSISSWNHAGDSCTPTCHGPQPWYGTPVSGTPHAMPNPGATHRVVGSGYVAACGGCHDYTNTGTYPATAGTPPNCRSCHLAGLGNGCSDCHGDAATGRPSVNSTAQSSFPTRRGQHQRSDHVNRACTACHPFTTGDARHGWSNRQKSTEAQVGGSGTNIRTWNTTTNTCTATCHGSENWY